MTDTREMIRKTITIRGTRTSIKLEKPFWDYAACVAEARECRVSQLIDDIAVESDATNLASAVRTFLLTHALGDPNVDVARSI